MPSPAPRISRVVQIARFRARVVGPPGILVELGALFPLVPMWPVSDRDAAAPAATFEVDEEAAAPEVYRVVSDGRPRWTGLRRCAIVPLLEWALTEAAVDWLGKTSALFHAGAVAHRGQGMLLTAVSGSGKTTLTAALIAEGFQLCSDEIGMLDPETGHLVPFPKRLCVKEGSYALLNARYPGLLAGAAFHQRGSEPTWYVDPPAEIWATAPAPVRFVVFPRYHPGARTVIAPVARSAALPLLLEQSFSAQQLGPVGIERVVALLQHAECYSLTVGDLATAVALLQGLYDQPAAR